MCNPDFDNLMNEVDTINGYLGTVGVLDALIYIQTHIDEYDGTQTLREYRRFMAEGARMFAPKETA